MNLISTNFKSILMCAIGLLAYTQLNSHGLKMSRMHLEPMSGHYELSLRFDLTDLVQTVHSECPEFKPEEKETWVAFFSTYIYDHVSIAANGTPVHYAVSLSEMDEHFIHFKGRTNQFGQPVEDLTISNSCMLSIVSDYSNVVSIQTPEKIRSFRLSKDRTSTKINL